MYFFQLVKTSPHLPFSPASSQTYLSTPSQSKRVIVVSIRVSQSLLGNAAVRISLKSVRWKESLTSSSSKIDTTENRFSSHSSKKSSVPDSPANRRSSKPLRMGSQLVTESLRPSVYVPHLGAVPRSPPLSGDVRDCDPSMPATIQFF